jgi:hypothetical protein
MGKASRRAEAWSAPGRKTAARRARARNFLTAFIMEAANRHHREEAGYRYRFPMGLEPARRAAKEIQSVEIQKGRSMEAAAPMEKAPPEWGREEAMAQIAGEEDPILYSR